MAEKEASLIVRLKDEASKGIDSLKSGLSGLKTAYLGVAAAVTTFIGLAVKAIQAYAEEEKEINKLTQALKNQGITTKQATKDITDYASQIQKTTAFSDTAVIQQAALLTSFGLVGDRMKQASAAARDLSVGLGIDLHTATLLVAKAANGHAEALGRYGIKVQEGKDKTETLNNILNALNSKFGGQAQAQLNTVTGQYQNLTNRIGELVDKVGQQLIPVFEAWASAGEKIISIMERMTGESLENNSVNEIALQKLREQRDAIIEQAQARAEASGFVVRLTDEERKNIEVITQNINAIKTRVTEEQIANQQILQSQIDTAAMKNQIDLEQQAKDELARQKKITDAMSDSNTLIQNLQTETNKMKGIKDAALKDDVKRMIERLKALGQDGQARLLQEKFVNFQIEKGKDEASKKEEERQKNMKQNFQSTMQFISSLSQSKNKELAAIGKAAAISDATIRTFQAANVAMTAAPPPFSFALAAAAVAAGMANVAKIAGVGLAQGGVVMPRIGGTQAVIGEGGSAEAVIPLGDERAREKLDESGLGQTTINLNVGVLVGSENNVKELARMIDQEIFTLRRNNESVAFGLL